MSARANPGAVGAKTGKTEMLTLAQALTQAMHQEMALDPRVVVLGEDVGKNGGVFRVTEGLYDAYGPDRVMDTPVAESGIIGVALGLALGGLRPVAELQFMGFLYPAMNQLLAHVARYRNRSRGRFAVPMVVRMPSMGGIKAPEHHSESYEALLVNTPGLKVVCPATPIDAKGLLIAAMRDDDPVMFMEPMRVYRSFREPVPVEPYEIPIGKAKVVKPGKQLTLVTFGSMVQPAQEAVDAVGRAGIDVELIDLRTIKPLDTDTVFASVEKTGRLVVVHEAPKSCGIGAEIAALVQERLMLKLHAPVARVTGFDIPPPYPLMEDYYLPHRERIVKAIRQTMEF